MKRDRTTAETADEEASHRYSETSVQISDHRSAVRHSRHLTRFDAGSNRSMNETELWTQVVRQLPGRWDVAEGRSTTWSQLTPRALQSPVRLGHRGRLAWRGAALVEEPWPPTNLLICPRMALIKCRAQTWSFPRQRCPLTRSIRVRCRHCGQTVPVPYSEGLHQLRGRNDCVRHRLTIGWIRNRIYEPLLVHRRGYCSVIAHQT